MTPKQMAARAKNRVARMSADDLLLWADNAASGIQRQLDDFRRDPDESHLGEISLGLMSMGYVIDEMGRRMADARKRLTRP